MANEVMFTFQSAKTMYFMVRNRVGQIWNGSAFESYTTANYSTYVNTASEQGVASAYYTGNFPSGIPAGAYSIVAKQQLGGSAVESDPYIAEGDFQWNGVSPLPLSDLATSGQIGQLAPIRIARGNMVQSFPFKLVSAVDHITPLTSGICSGQISRDGSAFGPLQSGGFNEIGLGWYSVQALTSGDLLCNTAALVFTANAVSGGPSDARDFGFITQRTSGQ